VSDFARLEVEFVLLDPRWHNLNHAARSVYLTLWVRAVNLRSECLPAYYSQSDLCREATVSRTTLVRSLKQLQEKVLIKIGEDGRITVCGVRSKHQKLHGWKNGDKGDEPRQESQSQKESREESSVIDPISSDEIDQKPPNVGEPIAGGGGSTAKTKFMEVARQKLDVNAAGLLERCVAGVKSAKVFRDGLAILEKCPRQIALMVWYAVKADNSAAYFTDVVKRGEVESECDAARIWAELASNQRKAVQA